jgi:hypothetical protein
MTTIYFARLLVFHFAISYVVHVIRERTTHLPAAFPQKYDVVDPLYLRFCNDIVNGVRRLDLTRDGLPCQSLDENLHTSNKTVG